MEKLILIFLCLPFFCNGQNADRTLEPHASGEDVVDATIDKIRSKCILSDDKYLMRRIAAVETDFGKNLVPNTGGIWMVTNAILSSARSSCQYRMRTICNNIVKELSFDITRATMSQMDIPLFSALVMYTYLSDLGTRGAKIPASRYDQANFWIRYIRPNGNKNNFNSRSSIKISCSAVKMDLVFAIDASGSVGSSNFRRTLTFLQNVVKDLQIGPNMTRVAVIRYASSATISFNFDTYNTASQISAGISNILYTGGGTATSKAIYLARDNIAKQARPNVPTVFVLITDGYSNSRSRTITAANQLKSDLTTIFTIGIGSVNPYEMLAVASDPSCTHYFSLNSYNEIDSITREIQRESCVAPIAVDINNGPVQCPIIDNNPIPSDNTTKIQNINVDPVKTPTNQNGTTNTTNVKVVVVCGTVNIYAHHLHTPSSSIYTYSAVATDGSPGWIRSPADKKLYLSLVSGKRLDLSSSACAKPHYNVSFNPPDEGVTIICRQNGIERECTPNDIKVSFGPLCGDDNVPNPCTKTNILNNKMRFKHPKSPNKYIQCKVSGKMEIVKCPAGTQYDESQSVCGPQITGPPSNSKLYSGANPCTRKAIMNRQFYFANPSDKSTFIQCDEWGTAFLVQCPKNTAWSQQAYTCVHHSSVVSHSKNPCSSSNPPFYHENPGNRRSFIQCDNHGNAFTVQCPLGTVWLQAKLTCVHDSVQLGLIMNPHVNYSVSPPPTPTRAPKCKNGEFLPHKIPSKYIVCGWAGKMTVLSCPAGLVWYQATKVCSWPSGSG